MKDSNKRRLRGVMATIDDQSDIIDEVINDEDLHCGSKIASVAWMLKQALDVFQDELDA